MDKIGFGTLNSIVLAIYLLAMLGVGMYFTKKAGESTDEFFKAGGNIPSWAVGFSIYATTLSAITFMATPEKHSTETGHMQLGTFQLSQLFLS